MLRGAIVGVLFLAGCTSHPTYHADIEPIMTARCVQCHSEGGSAPFSLTSYDEVAHLSAAIVVAVENGTMPPWSASTDETQYRHDPSLSDEQIQTISTWVKEGMERGQPGEASADLEPVGLELERVDQVIGMDAPYAPTGYPDDYRCFPIAWPAETSKYVRGHNAAAGNKILVHHIAVYNIPPSYAHLPFEWQGEDDDEGYPCFGGPSGGRDQKG